MLRKVGIVAVVGAVLGWLFWQSVQGSLSEPYVIERGLVAEWQLVLRGPMQPGVGVLVLQPTDLLRAELFSQIFGRTMESMTSPAVAAIPVLLHSEYQSVQEQLSLIELEVSAQEAGLDRALPTPICIGHLRRPPTHQLYYALFSAPEVDQFRQGLSQREGSASSLTESFPLVIPLAASDGNFSSWWPLDVSEADCQAPLEVQ